MSNKQKHPKSIINTFWLGLVFIWLSSCSSGKKISYTYQESRCNQQNFYSYTEDEIPTPLHELEIDTSLTNNFSFKSLNIAYAIGILDLMEDLISASQEIRENPSVVNQLNYLRLSDKIQRKINIASLEISAVASELDCEEERFDQIADYLRSKEDQYETRLTVAAIVIGATSAIIAGVFLANDFSDSYIETVGITTGIIEATLGLLILTSKRKIHLNHPRNPLRELWEGQTVSTIFPIPVWYYLNYFNPENPEKKSFRYEIISGWMGFKQISDASTKNKRKLYETFFGDGGKYTSEQLYNRANMYDQLESYINLMKQELMHLSVEIDRYKNQLSW